LLLSYAFPAFEKIHQKSNHLVEARRRYNKTFNRSNQLQNNSGYLTNLAMLYTEEMIHEDFEELTCDMSEIQRVVLKWGGEFHSKADIIPICLEPKNKEPTFRWTWLLSPYTQKIAFFVSRLQKSVVSSTSLWKQYQEYHSWRFFIIYFIHLELFYLCLISH
jgi:hypothetical protein